MNLQTWQQISELKSNILNLVKILVADNETPLEFIARDLIKYVKDVHELEETFRKNTIKDHRLLCELALEPFSVTKPEEILEFNLSHWRLVVNLKSMLLSVSHALLEDKQVRKEEIASRLLGHVYCINQIEDSCINHLHKSWN
jgi:hypothetical protein